MFSVAALTWRIGRCRPYALDLIGHDIYAVEQIRPWVEPARQAFIPLMALLGNVPASGGYWLPCQVIERVNTASFGGLRLPFASGATKPVLSRNSVAVRSYR